MTPTTDPGKRIPKSLNTEANLIGSYTLTDAAVALTPGVIVVLGFQWLIPPGLGFSLAGYSFTLSMLTLPLAAVGVLLGGVFVLLTPSYTSSLGWLQAALGFHRGERELDFEMACGETRFERAHLHRNAIERQDGALIGLVEVSAPLLALATPSEWAAHTRAFADFCNTTLEYPIQIYSTTRAFDVDSYLSTYEDRLSDPDVLANPRLSSLIEGYIEWYETELASREMTIREHYVIVSVHPDSLTFESNSILQKAITLPLIGVFARVLTGARERNRSKETAFDVLDERCRTIASGLRGIEGTHTKRVDAETAVGLLSEFWGTHNHPRTEDGVLRETPLVTPRGRQ